MQIAILGDGGLGREVEAAASAEGHGVRLFGRPPDGRHLPGLLRGADVIVDASRAEAVLPNLAAAADGGCRRVVIATTGWAAERPSVEALLRDRAVAAVAASNFSLGMALFGRLVDAAVDLYGALPAFDPFLLEWHRRVKADRPSGTAADLARRITARHPAKHRTASDPFASVPPAPDELEVVSLRAGASPGMHLVGFDSAGETVELRLTARDRSAYAAGILAASTWLVREPRAPGIHAFDGVVDALLTAAPVAPAAA
jgi:4-hydroxy-tetrahydrodipicolinate reductase